jgi:hypothetical protein
MLGTLWSRCVASTRRGASKLGYHSSENGTRGSAFSKLKNPSNNDTQIPLEGIYAANQEVHYQTAVAAATTPDLDRGHAHADRDRDRDSGSEVALTDQEQHYKQDANGIRVQTKWTISHN